MSLFGKEINLKEKDIQKINSILPDSFQKNDWSASEFKNEQLYIKYSNHTSIFTGKIENAKKKLSKLKSETENTLASKLLIFNTELTDAKPIGFVDFGFVTKFGTASTGNRFENGVIGYAIEGAIDDVWSQNNAQYGAVQMAKLELLKKAKKLYPDCTSIFKFEIDFREIGSSGNVFIYVRGTAASMENITLSKTVTDIENEISSLEKEIDELSPLTKDLLFQKFQIPKNVKELESFLKKENGKIIRFGKQLKEEPKESSEKLNYDEIIIRMKDDNEVSVIKKSEHESNIVRRLNTVYSVIDSNE